MANWCGRDVILIGNSIQPPVTGAASTQLGIGKSTNYWITGDSSFNIKPGAGILDSGDNVGTAGSVLASTGSGVCWVAAGGGGSGGCLKLDSDVNIYSDGVCAGCDFDGTNACYNIAIGCCAGHTIASGSYNVALGYGVMSQNTT